jgi:hypothetical protein
MFYRSSIPDSPSNPQAGKSPPLVFSIADMVTATALVAGGVAVLITGFAMPLRHSNPTFLSVSSVLALWFGGPALIGAGIGWPLHRPILGGVLGFLAMLALFFLFVLGNC